MYLVQLYTATAWLHGPKIACCVQSVSRTLARWRLHTVAAKVCSSLFFRHSTDNSHPDWIFAHAGPYLRAHNKLSLGLDRILPAIAAVEASTLELVTSAMHHSAPLPNLCRLL